MSEDKNKYKYMLFCKDLTTLFGVFSSKHLMIKEYIKHKDISKDSLNDHNFKLIDNILYVYVEYGKILTDDHLQGITEVDLNSYILDDTGKNKIWKHIRLSALEN